MAEDVQSASLGSALNDARTIGQLFKASVRLHGDRPSLWVDGRVLTYAELHDAAARLARSIVALRGAGGGQCGVLAARSATAYASVLGALLAGDAYVPLNPRFPTKRLAAILSASAIDTVIVDDRSAGVAEALLAMATRPVTVILPGFSDVPDWAARLQRHRIVAEAEIERAAPGEGLPSGDAQDGAYLLFTSGSTGAPKGVPVRHANVLTYVSSAVDRYCPRPEDRFTQLFDFSFDLSVHDMFVCWAAGACLYCVPQSATMAPRAFVRNHELTFWFSVPSTAAFMARMHMLRPGDYPSLRWSLFCGEALPTQLAFAWRAAAPNAVLENLYGPTEATIAISAYRADRPLAGHAVVPIGEPLPGQHAVIVDENGGLVPDGCPGELCVGGTQVVDGYWRLPELTAQRFAAPRGLEGEGTRWYRTGDRVARDAEHGLIFLGRLDSQVKISGHRVELQEVETALRVAASCDSVAAVAWPKDEDGLARGIVALVSGTGRSDAEILAACRERLPDYMVPSRVQALADWPVNPNGKTDYRRLEELLQGGNAGEG